MCQDSVSPKGYWEVLGKRNPYHFGAFCLYSGLLRGTVSRENEVPGLVSLDENLGQGGMEVAVTKGVGDSYQ